MSYVLLKTAHGTAHRVASVVTRIAGRALGHRRASRLEAAINMIYPVLAHDMDVYVCPRRERLRQLLASCKTIVNRSPAPDLYDECMLVAEVTTQNTDLI